MEELNIPFKNNHRKIYLLWALYSIVLFAFATSKHLLLGSSAWDLGIFEQFSWLIANGKLNTVSSLRGITPLQDHFSILLIPIGLIYKIIPSTLSLLALQSISLASVPFLIIRLARKKNLPKYLTRAIVSATILSPIIFLANIANFHPEVVSTPFMLLALSEVENIRGRNYYSFLLLSLAAKKSQVLFGAGLAIYGFLKGKRYRSAMTFSISLSWWIISSRFTNQSGDYIIDRLGYLGDSYLQILITLLVRPWSVFEEAPIDTIFLYTLGLLLSFVILLGSKSWQALISALPIYLTNVISSAGTHRELYSQYSIAILPFLVVASLDSYQNIIKGSKNSFKRIYYFTIVISFISFLGYSRIGYYPSRYFPRLAESREFHKLKSNIEANSGILTTDHYAAHFSNREMVHTIEDNDYKNLSRYDYILLPNKSIKSSLEPATIDQIIKQSKDFKFDCFSANEHQIICSKKFIK